MGRMTSHIEWKNHPNVPNPPIGEAKSPTASDRRGAAAASARTPAAASPRPPWEDRRTSWPPGGPGGAEIVEKWWISRFEAWKTGRFLDSKPETMRFHQGNMMI